MFFGQTKKILGLDIGTSYIKAVELKKTEDKPEISSYGMVNVIYPSVESHKIDILKETSVILSKLYDKSGFTTKKAIISLPANVAFVSVMDLPPMPEKDMQKSVEFQAKKYVPLPLNEVNLSWQILSQKSAKIVPDEPKKDPKDSVVPNGILKANLNFTSKKSEPMETKILLTAVAKNVINNYLKVIQDSGIEPTALEIETLSQIRSLITPGEKGTSMIIDIGAKATTMTIVNDGALWATKSLSVGGDSLTRSISRSMGVSFSRAEVMKRDNGSDIRSAMAQFSMQIVDSIISEASQLNRIMSDQGRNIEHVIITGGGSSLPTLTEKLKAISPKIMYGDPLINVSYDPAYQKKLEAVEQQLTVAIGLALRGLKS